MSTQRETRSVGVACENCGCEERWPREARCVDCGRFAPDPIYGYSIMTDSWYRATDWDRKDDAHIQAREKEKVAREEVPQHWIEAIEGGERE